jgi:MFS family permease
MVDDRADLSNAIALNSTMINITRMIGPSVAGILVALFGEGICFFLNGLSYVAVIWALLLMRLKTVPVRKANPDIFLELKEGFQYVFAIPPIRSIILLLGLISLVGMSYTVIMPVYVQEILHGGAHTLGFLMGAVGLGSLLAALFLASRRQVVGLERYIPQAAAIIGLGLVGFSLARTFWLAFPLLFCIGFGMIVQMTSSNTIIQTIVDESKRGRVMSIYTMAFLGMGPFGSLFTGGLAHLVGVMTTLFSGGCVCLVGTVLFASKVGDFRKRVRAMYLKLGLVSELPSGTQTVVEISPKPYRDDS